MSGPVHHTSRPSHPSSNPPADPPKDKPNASQFPGVDTLYSAAGTVKSTFSSFVLNVLNGAQVVVKTIAYVIFYPFFNDYAPQATPEQHAASLERVKGVVHQKGDDKAIDKDATFRMRFSELEAKSRVGSRNKGDAKYAKEVIQAFAEVEKEAFEEIAKEVIEMRKIDMDQITLTHGAYVLMLLDNGSMTVGDFYHSLNMYRVKNVGHEEQMTILAFEVELAEINKGEVPSAQETLLLYAEVNPSGFAILAECLGELTDEVKASDEKTLAVDVKEWIEKKERFNPAKMREALDLVRIKDEIKSVQGLPLVDQLQQLSEFLRPKATEAEKSQSSREPISYRSVKSEARKVFIVKKFLDVLDGTLPHLMKRLATEMIKQDEKSERKVGLFEMAKGDAKWEKVDFEPVHHVLAWTKDEEKFKSGCGIIYDGLRRVEANVLKEGFSSGNLSSVRLNYFDLASIRFRMDAFKDFVADFVNAKGNEKIGLAFLQTLIQIDATKGAENPDSVRLIPEQPKDADLTVAVVEVAKEAAKKDAESTVLRGRVRDAVASVQSEQFQVEMESDELEFSSKLESFLLLSTLPLEKATFPREMLALLAASSETDFAKLVMHIAEKFSSVEAVKRLDASAKASPLHPDQIAKQRQEAHDARNFLTKLVVSAPAELTEGEQTLAKQAAYRDAFLKHFASDSRTFKSTDMEWLCNGMRSYLEK